ncbi:helix-turn-helix domain-containing protein [Sinomonas sp. JGH33]|uniref:Helix-turn-helix domain-containing protein n=1 Tax=Sinomonas terricola TaxID=3110330 RepID=A0ABU5T7Y4_9MICC|nr:helix-turn-helix domain-containing protein [Sinomonas sp. JGH33]MEA5455755.1 helix-turn-helix domain-containing protein [Sinomonas sp. JGH33]
MHSPATPEANARWSELLSALAERSAQMADEFIERVAGIREYGTGLVAAEDVRATAAHTFSLLVSALRAGGTTDDGPLAYARELGARRARSGIPPSSLTSAVRLDFSIIWSHLLELAAEGDAALLASRVESVWHVVDAYAAETHTSYLAERVRMAQEESSVQREFVAQLFGPESLSPDSLTRIGAALRVDPSASFVVAAGSGAAGAVIRALGGGVPGRVRVHVYEAGSAVYGFWQEPRSGSPVPAGLARVPCGLVRGVSGLAGLRASAAVAAALADEANDDDAGPLELEAAWHRVARRLLEDSGISLAALLDRSLEACRDSERERLEETARTFIANGSVTETAAALYCHRNTILNRLARFHELTGVDLSVPQQAARVLVAWA